jgi:GntR family transcriptional regulator
LVAKLSDALAERLRRDIEAGVYPPGSLLPAERTLARDHDVSRVTAQGALRKLVGWGMVLPRHGRGYEVRQDTRLRWIASDHERGGEGPPPNDSWSRQVRMQGRTPGEEILAVEQVLADDDQAERLGVSQGTVLVARRRLRTVDGVPHMIATSLYPYEIVKDTPIAQPIDVQPGVFAIFDQMGRPWTSHRIEHLIARLATKVEQDLLELPTGEPVLQLTRVSRDRAGVPVRLYVVVMRDGEIEFDYEEQ